MRLGTVQHPTRDVGSVLAEIGDWAAAHGSTVAPPGVVDGSLDLLVAVGGDGTLLGALRAAAPHAVPVLGVATGHVSFLADVPADEVTAALDAVASRRAHLEPLLGLEASLPGGGAWTAFNDVVVSRVAGRGPLDVDVVVDGDVFVRYGADAVVVSSPLGSTAYALAAGGPIVAPAVPALLVTPVAPQRTLDRSLVVSTDQSLRLDVRGIAHLEADGQLVAEVSTDASLTVAARMEAARLLRRPGYRFHRHARARLLLSDSPRMGGH